MCHNYNSHTIHHMSRLDWSDAQGNKPRAYILSTCFAILSSCSTACMLHILSLVSGACIPTYGSSLQEYMTVMSIVGLFTVAREWKWTRCPEADIWIRKLWYRRRSQDGGKIGWGDHFLPYKFIKRTIERWANFTKQLLIASRRHQAPRKAAHCLQKEVG